MALPPSHPSMHIPLWALISALATMLAYVAPVVVAKRLLPEQVRSSLHAAWGLHFLTLVATLFAPPVHFGFAPALSITAWLMLTMYLIEQRLYPRMKAAGILSLMGAVAVLLAVIFPGAELANLHSVWQPLHLTLGVACYGLFAAAVVHAGLMTRAERRMRNASHAGEDAGVPLLTLERIMFRSVSAGFVLLSATLLVGWLFSEVLYGHPWRWDHKTVFSVLAWAVFAVLLLGRVRFGWRGQRAARMVYIGAGMLLLGYAGSRFVLQVLLERGV